MRNILFRGQIVTVDEKRIRFEERNSNLFYYEIRHKDNDLLFPIAIEENILINFWGTLIAKEPISLKENGWKLTKNESQIIASESGGIFTDKLREFFTLVEKYNLNDIHEVVLDRCLDYSDLKGEYEGDGPKYYYRVGFGENLGEAVELISKLNELKEAMRLQKTSHDFNM